MTGRRSQKAVSKLAGSFFFRTGKDVAGTFGVPWMYEVDVGGGHLLAAHDRIQLEEPLTASGCVLIGQRRTLEQFAETSTSRKSWPSCREGTRFLSSGPVPARSGPAL